MALKMIRSESTVAIVLLLIAAEGNEIEKYLFKVGSSYKLSLISVSAYDYDDAFEDAFDDFHEFGKS